MREKRGNFAEARKHVRATLAEMAAGRPRPYIDCWAASNDTTPFGGPGGDQNRVSAPC